MHIGVVRVTVEQVDGTGQNRQEHIEIVRNHLDGHVQFAVQLGQHVYGGALTGQIEVGQRLVKHQQLWVAHQRLGDGHTLAQTAGQFGQTVPRLVGDAGELHRLERFGFLGLGDGVDAESGAGQAQQHGLFGGEIGIDIRHIALRHISDAFVHLACGLAQHGQAAMAERQKAQLGPYHRGFAGAVGADDGRDRTGGNGEGAMLPDDMVATLDGGIAEHDAIGSFTHNARLWQTMLTIVLNIVYGW